MSMFNKILIANRGEIACRVIKACRKLNIYSIAIYSDADQDAQHVQLADEAYYVGAASSQASYLNASNIIAIALRAQADAIHPGYGFLSENAEFAENCTRAGIKFIGPSAAAIRAMGLKNKAKQIMQQANVPVVPGYHGEQQADDFLLAQANSIGYPVLIKAAAGGGGKGMRIVQQPSDFLEALATTRREAQASFANSDMILEKYISNPRHIEIQILADQQGHCLYLFERDCSIQRRHQKVIEEAPAPHLLPALRQAMGQTAIAAANAIHYEGAGTIEFLYDSEQHFYFMEMNTRLQVEHPVTECITGQDLVKLQIEIAMGYPLSLQQSDLHIQGHAIEARIYAENPHNHFLPSTGTIHYLQEPQQSRHVRIDSGIATGSHISMHYDPMLAKLIVWDETRKAAIKRLQRTLNAYQLVGLHTNITYLNKIISHPDFIAGKVNTHFIQNHEQSLLELPPVDNNLLALISFFYAKYTAQKQQQRNSNDQTSPWLQQQAWRANHACNHTVTFTLNDNAYHIPICYQKQQLQITLDGKQSVIHGHIDAHGKVNIEYQQQRLQATCQLVTQTLYIFTSYGQYRAQLIAENDFSASVITTGNHLHAPMPGAIIAINTTVDAQVKAGDALIVMEAMKMEHTIYAPNDGQIAEIFYPVGAQVMEGAELITLATTTTKNDLFPANHESFNKTSDNTLDKH